MLLQHLQLNKATEIQLKRLKSHTQLPITTAARISFFYSIEHSQLHCSTCLPADGKIILSVQQWLGPCQLITESVLQLKYPHYKGEQLEHAWRYHVEQGIAGFRNHRDLESLINNLAEIKYHR